MSATDDDDGIEIVPIPMDRATRANLAALARVIGKPPAIVAGLLLRDVVHDDAMAHALPRRPANLN